MLFTEGEVKFAIPELDVAHRILWSKDQDSVAMLAKIRQAEDVWCDDYLARNPQVYTPNLGKYTSMFAKAAAKVAVKHEVQYGEPMKKSEALAEHVVVPLSEDEVKFFGALLAFWLFEERQRESEEGDITAQTLADYAEIVAYASVYDEGEEDELGPNDEAIFLENESKEHARIVEIGEAMMQLISKHIEGTADDV